MRYKIVNREKMKICSYFIVFIGLMLGLSSCQEKIEYPIVPYLDFQDFVFLAGEDSVVNKGQLIFYFTDGDGDIGLDENDTLPPYDFNLFIDYYERQDGNWTQLVLSQTGDTINFNGRIPVLTPGGKNKSISGTIEYTLDLNIFSEYDTFRYEAYLIDRALHESNRVITPALVKP